MKYRCQTVLLMIMSLVCGETGVPRRRVSEGGTENGCYYPLLGTSSYIKMPIIWKSDLAIHHSVRIHFCGLMPFHTDRPSLPTTPVQNRDKTSPVS